MFHAPDCDIQVYGGVWGCQVCWCSIRERYNMGGRKAGTGLSKAVSGHFLWVICLERSNTEPGREQTIRQCGKPSVQYWSSVLVLLSLAPQKYQEITLFNLRLLPALNICRQRGPAYKFHWAKCSTSVLNLSCTACTWMDKKRAVLPTELPVLPFQLTADLQQQEQGWKRTQ